MAINFSSNIPQQHWSNDFPDIGKVLEEAQARAIKPRVQAEELVGSMLKNKLGGIKAQFEEPLMRAKIQQALAAAEHSRRASNTTMDPITKALMIAKAKGNMKAVEKGEENIPSAEAMLQEIDQALEVIPKHKKWFGAAKPGLGWISGPEARKRSITSEEYGPVEALFGRLVGPQAQELSHGNKVLATALNLAQGIKPGFGENYPIAHGKLQRIRDELAKSIEHQTEKYHAAGGTQEIGNYRGFEPRTTFKSADEFHSYMRNLTPHQRSLVKRALTGR